MTNSILTAAGWPRRWVQWVVLGVVLGVGLLVRLDAPEIGLMEARNFVAAREMHAGGSWLLPTMNGELRLAKPPLPTWLVAAVMHLTGSTTDLGLLRLPSALGAGLLVLFCWALARRLTPPADEGRTAWLAALVLASSLLLLTAGRDGNGWDIYCYSFMLGALAAAVRGLQAPGRGWGWFALGGVLIGLSILSKGPVAPYGMLLPFLLAYALRGERAALRRQWPGLLLMIGVGLALGGSWPLYVLSQHQSEASQVAQVESSSWANRHVQPFWFYVSFPVFMGFWALAALAALVWPYAAPRVRPYAPYALVLAWVAATLLLLSLVPEKKERYLLPVLPPLALLAAGLLRHWLSPAAAPGHPADRWVPRAWAALVLLLTLAVPVAMPLVGLRSFAVATGRYWLVTGLCVVIATLVLQLWRGGRVARAAAVGSLGLTLLASGLLMPAYPEWQRRRDDPGLRPLARVVAERSALREGPVYRLGDMHIKWIWTAGRAVPLWEPARQPEVLERLPLLVYAPARGAAPFPAGWGRRLRITTIDSFDVSHQFADGRWYVTEIRRD
ncbi:glycosyl transferase [Hymenobacter gummosus]|uniref:Glycosyl transferase n=1 Tax=Hymenobacter gummosus TaxID=1776032 RepID=A0A3S0H1D6_9BACT|nr:glycosyltransferase family 39 protein [Hymenobacter gummosus]RTQ45688.1 glycosyl transferase [Hymenobacter gummosus]